tara:strand:+ start:528 stop:791 length:264 start_codon:yes stop_codon:yes gene_type:complete
MIIIDDTNTCNECGAYYINKKYCVNGHYVTKESFETYDIYVDALEQAIILLDDNPNITDECDGVIVSNEPDIAKTLFELKKEIEKGY